MAVFADEGASAEHDVLRALAISATGIDISADEARALALNERTQVTGLADELVARTEVEDDVGTSEGEVR